MITTALNCRRVSSVVLARLWLPSKMTLEIVSGFSFTLERRLFVSTAVKEEGKFLTSELVC